MDHFNVLFCKYVLFEFVVNKLLLLLLLLLRLLTRVNTHVYT